MKKTLKITVLFLTLIVGLACGVKEAHAVEEPNVISEQEESPNYYKTSVAYENTGYISGNARNHNDYTNIIPVIHQNEEYDLFISAIYETGKTSGGLDCSVYALLFDSNMRVIDEINLNYEKYTNFTDTKANFYVKIDMNQIYSYDARYMMIEFVPYYETLLLSENLRGMCIKYVESNNDIKQIKPDYVANDNVRWTNKDYEYNYYVFSYNVSFDSSINEIIKNIEALDVKTQNKLPITVYSLNTASNKVIGETYSYVLKVTDSSGVEDFVVVNLTIEDTEAPVIYGTKNYMVSAKNPISINAIKNSLFVVDNFDTNVQIQLKNDHYSDNASVPGVYVVEFYAVDSAGNRCEYDVYITVNDINGPVFYNEYGQTVNRMSVFKSTDSVFVYKEVIDLLTAVDEVDGNVDISVYRDNYTGFGDIPGSYTITLRAVDSNNNSSYFTVDIVVSSEMPSKTLIYDKRIVVVETTTKLTTSNVAKMMKMCGFYNDATTSYIDIYMNNYQDYSNIVGDYIISYEISATNGSYSEGSMNVRVVESRSSGNTIKNEKVEDNDDGFIVRVFKWIWNLIKSIFSWFFSIFK